MRVLFSTGSPARYMAPPLLGDEQIVCGPDWPDDIAPDGRVRSLATPVGEYDLAAVAAKLPADHRPDVVVCLVDASWRNLPRNLASFDCPRVLLVADTHHLTSPLLNMLRYLMAETYDRVVLLYDRHHASFFHAVGIQNLYWFPGLTLPHGDAAVRKARAVGARAARIAFVGQAGQHHPRRARLLDALVSRKLPIQPKPLGQNEGLAYYGSSLLGFNASLNGDLNLRIFEILASGAALLTDQLASASGLGQLFTDGRELITYDSPEELAERAAHALAHPQETRTIGAAGAAWFDEHFNAARRQAAFRALAFDGTPVPEFAFSLDDTTRVFFGGDTDRFVQSLMVYEGVQEMHRTDETVRLAIDPAVPNDVKEIFATLPRIEFTGAGQRADMAIFGREQAIQGVEIDASRMWCWDAAEPDFDELTRAFGPAGFRLASRDVAVLCHDAADATPTSATPAASVAGPKHILLVTDDPDSGGVAQYNHTILCRLAQSGYRMSCLQSRVDNPLIAEQQREGVTHHWIEYHTGRDFARTVTDATEALRIYQSDRPDLIIFSNCCPVSNLAAREAARRLGLAYLVVEGFVGTYLAQNFAAQMPMLAEQYRAARAVIAVSQENLNLLHTHFGLPLAAGQVIHYGRPSKFFAPRDEAVRTRLRAEIGVPADAVVCFTAARLAAVKNYSAQIEAARSLARRPGGDRIHFVWAGDGEDRPALEKSIAAAGLGGRIHLLGHRWDVADWYDAADIFVLPSDLEGMPLAIMEAMAKNLPVIATAVSGIPEELGTTGHLLTPATRDRSALVNELTNTIHAWAQDPAKRAALGRRAHTRAEALFSEGLMVGRMLSLVSSFAGPAPTPLRVWKLAETIGPNEVVPFLEVSRCAGQNSFREASVYAPNRARSTARLIAAALEERDFGDLDFLVNLADKPGALLDRLTFSYSTVTDDYSRVCPDFLFDAWTEVHIDDYEKLCGELGQAGRQAPTDPRIGWIGVPMVAARQHLVDLGRRHPALIEAIDIEWDRSDTGPNSSPQYLSLPDQVRRWKYLIDVEGHGWSARLKTFFFTGRVIFIAERPWKEWYFEHLQPWVHYVPVRRDLSDLVENYQRIESDPALQQSIIAAARKFATQHLTRKAAIERWRWLLAENFGHRQPVKPSVKNSVRRIIVVPAGRRRYLEVLLRYLEQQKTDFDEVRLWLNTTDADDLAFCAEQAQRHAWITAVPPRGKVDGIKSIHQFFTDCTVASEHYLRLDDDVVYLEPGFVENMFRFRAEHPDYFLVFGNVVNNAVVTHLRQQLTRCNHSRPVGYNCLDPVGWQSGEFAHEVHAGFLDAIVAGRTDEWKFRPWRLDRAEIVSINSICWRGAEFACFDGKVGVEEERWLTETHPAAAKVPNIINGSALCAHYAFWPQREYLDNTDLLARYRSLLPDDNLMAASLPLEAALLTSAH